MLNHIKIVIKNSLSSPIKDKKSPKNHKFFPIKTKSYFSGLAWIIGADFAFLGGEVEWKIFTLFEFLEKRPFLGINQRLLALV